MNIEAGLAEVAKLRASANELEALFLASAPEAAPKAPAPPSAPPVAARVASAGLTAPAAFFNHLRGRLWPKMTAAQVAGCNSILAAGAGILPLAWQAYAFATTYHETAYTMQPIREKGSGDGADADAWDDYLEQYDTGEKAKRLGNTPDADGDGVLFAGRGYVQLTGAANYRKATTELRALGVISAAEDMFVSPDLALRGDIAAAVLVYGMKAGWFTGKTFNHYLPGVATEAQFKNARRIINGIDRAAQIAGYAVTFQDALKVGGWK